MGGNLGRQSGCRYRARTAVLSHSRLGASLDRRLSNPKFRVLGRGQSRGVLRVRAPAGRWSCLRQGEGERDGRADEVEGAPLDWCRLADLVEADVTDGDGGPGERGQVVEQAAEAAHRVS